MIETAKFIPLGIYGGTFDPVHFGHLRVAEELVEILQLDRLYFMPANQPRLRNVPVAGTQHRVAMLQRAISDNANFFLDDREIHRPGETYSVESLREIHQENNENEKIAFCFVVGSDAFIKLPKWYCWQELFELCHLVIVNRPGGAQVTDPYFLPLTLRKICSERWVTCSSELKTQPSGLVYVAPTTFLDVSSTKIRALIASKKSARYLLPESVLDYINMHNFYAGGK